jgi:hypothetical protein
MRRPTQYENVKVGEKRGNLTLLETMVEDRNGGGFNYYGKFKCDCGRICKKLLRNIFFTERPTRTCGHDECVYFKALLKKGGVIGGKATKNRRELASKSASVEPVVAKEIAESKPTVIEDNKRIVVVSGVSFALRKEDALTIGCRNDNRLLVFLNGLEIEIQ